ncbi:unnamed protein product [Phytophthora lilii]|uniref:Unnamed protein product n=1 Tax=Phytophthora lilii TaxID=2077276 RepID=A0A9W6WY01_9STRA|nr:unnamed protein product [Phytophthora lilii]
MPIPTVEARSSTAGDLWRLKSGDPLSPKRDRLHDTWTYSIEAEGPRSASDLAKSRVGTCQAGVGTCQARWNGSANSLASAALQRQGGAEIIEDSDRQDLVTLNRLDDILIVRTEDPITQVLPVMTRSKATPRSKPRVLQEGFVRELRIDRFRKAQDEEIWIVGLNMYLKGDVGDLDQEEARSYGKVAMDYEVDSNELLFYCPPTKRSDADRDGVMRLVAPETLHQDILHHYHSSIEGGHQGIGRTYQRIRDQFHWRGLYRSVQQSHTVAAQTTVCDLWLLPYKGNTELLIGLDVFTGYVTAKASSSRSAQTIAESYKECVFRRFRASEVIRHDREPGFMSDFFRAFNKILGQRQRATRAYRPQSERDSGAHGSNPDACTQDVCPRSRSTRLGRICRTLNVCNQQRSRSDPRRYAVLLGAWLDPRSTLEATIPVGSTRRQDRDPRRWRYRIQRYYQQAREQVNERLREAIADCVDQHNEEIRPHKIETGSKVWLYLDRVKEGYASKLAHLWHGPIRVTEKISDYAVKLQISGTDYHIFPTVHVSKLKLVREFPDRPQIQLNLDEADRLDFDESLLPEARIWIPTSTRWRRSPTCDLVRRRGLVESTENFWCTGVAMTNRAGWMSQISTVERCCTSFCGIAQIETDLA